MKSIEEIANKYLGTNPNDVDCETWSGMRQMFILDIIDFKNKAVNAKLEEAAEKAKVKYHQSSAAVTVDKESILSLKQ